VKLKIRAKNEEENEEEEVGFDTEELQMRLDFLALLVKDSDVSKLIRRHEALVPLDSHKLETSIIPTHLAEYIERAIDLQIDILQLRSNDDKEVELLESYRIQSKPRVYSANEGRLLKLVLGYRGGK